MCENSCIISGGSFLNSEKIKSCSGRHFGTMVLAQWSGKKLDPWACFTKFATCKLQFGTLNNFRHTLRPCISMREHCRTQFASNTHARNVMPPPFVICGHAVLNFSYKQRHCHLETHSVGQSNICKYGNCLLCN